jgi:hypothetical protein
MCRKKWISTLSLLATLTLAGCSVFINRAVDTAASTAGEQVGQEVGNRMANQMLAGLGPANLHGYTMALFKLTFYHGGYNLAVDKYEPGEYTRWRAEGSAQGDWFEKALLKRREDGSEWWRVESRSTGDDTKKQHFISEALLSAPDESGERKILRMRVKYPEDDKPSEVPVTEKDSHRWVVSSRRKLTEESYKGLKQGTESISTPAGRFQAEHLQTTYYGGKGHINWWLTEKVPGEVVKYKQTVTSEEQEDKTRYEMTLLEYGDGMTSSKLGAF